MSKIFTLDSMREEADRTFGAPVEIGLRDGSTVPLANYLRLPQKVREEISEKLDLINSIHEKDAEETTPADHHQSADAVFRILELGARDQAKRLLADLDGDLGLASIVLNTWLEHTQVGEADSSES